MIVSLLEVLKWVAAILAFVVSLLTLYNTARLKSGVLAVSTFAFGSGMLSLAGGFYLITSPAWSDAETISYAYHILFILGFLLLGFGSYKIYSMSKIK